jgi:ferredoxin-NADP reductase
MAYHQLRIAKIVQETPDARSFVLKSRKTSPTASGTGRASS